MRVSYNWLRDYIDVRLEPERLSEALTMAGLTVESIQPLAGDHILEIEVTANRPDWLSMIGIAREIAAITGGRLKNPAAAGRAASSGKERPSVSVKIEEKSLCSRYTARIIRNVKVEESPAWLKARIEAMGGLRSVNNIVDITNFCLFETGEPMHAFDLDALDGRQILVRKANAGEKIVSIDGAERTLDNSMLVIADTSRPVAIAGVIGGLNTEVTAATKNILLEAAYFDPVSVRRTSRKLGVSTESSYRFERKVDLEGIARFSDRASFLITEIAGGGAGEFIDIGQKKPPVKIIEARYQKFSAVLGLDIPKPRIKKILGSLGLKEKGASSKARMRLEVPPFRHDLNDEIDLIEEVARIYGYCAIPEKLPQIVEQPARIPANMIMEKKIRSTLAACGMNEIITYSLIGRRALAMAALSDKNIVEIANPLTSEQEIMRPGLVPGMLGAMLWNINRKTKDLSLFELGNIYIYGEDGKIGEKKHLVLGVMGEDFSGWASGARKRGFFDLKGAVETLLAELGIQNASFKYAMNEGFSPRSCASIEIGGSVVGILGRISKRVLSDFDIKETVHVCEISLDLILRHARLEKRFEGLPKYQAVHRDMSIIISGTAAHADIAAAIENAGRPMLKNITLIDRYIGIQIPDGKVSLTYRLEYQDLNRTLEEKDISEVHARILRELEEKFSARLR